MSDNQNFAPGDALILSPDVVRGKGGLTPRARSVKDVAHARQILTSLQSSMQETQKINGRIMAKYNAERPYQQAKLAEEGLGYRNNFTTKPLAQMVDKVAPRFVEAIQSTKYLTNAAFPVTVQGATAKTETFRKEITETIRARRGWRIFVEDLAQENGMFGYAVASWLDEYSWFPKAFRQDEIFLPEGTPQLTDAAQLVVLREMFLPHELFDLIDDTEAAETAGWNVAATLKAINEASPDNVRSAQSDWSRLYEDMRRELAAGCSFQATASVIPVYSLLAREVNGKVTHWRIGGSPQHELEQLFLREDRFESMADCLAFFSFQKGNGKMRGSKGIGRDIYELAGMIDRSRNEVVDRLILSGKQIFQGDPRALKRFKMMVMGNAILVEDGVQMLEKTIDGNVEGFLQLDAYLTQIVDQLIGSVSPPKLEGEAFRSPEAWKLFASREEEGRDTRVARFVDQFVDMLSTIQKRLCDPETTEKDGKEMQQRLLKHMGREELNEIAKQPVAGTIQDLTPLQRQQVIIAATENKGNPLYNQKALEEEKLTAQVSADFATRVLLPDNDPTVQSEQTRQQQIELQVLHSGQPVPVSPRDNHMIHLQVIYPLLEQTAGAVTQGQTGTATLEGMVSHANEHYNMAIQQGAPPEEFAPLKKLLDQLLQAITRLKEMDMKAQRIQDDSGGLQEEAVQEEVEMAQPV